MKTPNDRPDDDAPSEERDEPIEPYLWDRSAPESEDIKALEALLSPLALRRAEVPAPPPRRDDRSRAASNPPRSRWLVGGALGALSLAAAVAVGYFVGRAGTRPIEPAATRASSASGATSVASAPSPKKSSDGAAGLRCTAELPGEGALPYRVLSGSVTCDGQSAPNRGYLPLGAWLETDPSSRSMLDVADIGHVEISPRSRLRILPGKGAEHRLELARGALHARIDAPPRLFIVETEAGTAIDLGCVYSLEVGDDGSGLLRVGRGEVALQRSNAEVIVHAGEACEMRPRKGPGTPFPASATAAFRSALAAWDFEGGTLDAAIDAATLSDALGLLDVLVRAQSPSDRARVAEQLAKLVAPPKTATFDRLVHGDGAALEDYRKAILDAR